ncbi:MAG: hypothetical protein Kow0080_20360 [Candidatus Promineifilaceae bacterium]
MKQKSLNVSLSFSLSMTLLVLLWLVVQPAYAATITVNTAVDENDGSCVDGDCSLRDAVATAVAGDTIEIPAGSYTLTLGQITLSQNIALTGVGGTPEIGLGSSRIFQVDSGATVTLTNLILTGTNTSDRGAGLYVLGGATAVLNNITINHNATTDDGGGIYVRVGTITLQNSSIISNTADQGGGIYIDQGTVTLESGAINQNHTTATTVPSQGYSGGGVYVDSSTASFTMNGGEIVSNTVSTPNSTFPGGGVLVVQGNATLNGGEIRGHSAYRGAGLLVNSGNVTINGTNIVSNTSAYGAGIYIVRNTAFVTHTAGLIGYNTADPVGFNGNGITDFGGGGIYNFQGTFVSTGGDISYNHSTWNGGGIEVASGIVTVTNTTLAGNIANNSGGAFHSRNGTAVSELINSTLSANTPTAVSIENGTLTVKGSTLDNHPTAIQVDGGTMTAYANNITNYTTGVTGTGTFNGRHNWWGSGATAGTVGSTDAFDYRLGAAVVDWGEGTLADGAAISGGTGTGIVVSHGTAVPFGMPASPVGTACSNYYDFFTTPGASGSWTISVPVSSDAACDNTFNNGRLFHFALTTGSAPDTACSPESACWQLYSSVTPAAGTPRTLNATLTTTELGGTPIVVGNSDGNDPTAVSLQSLTANSGDNLAWTGWVIMLVLALASTAFMHKRKQAK